jgi:expansin (peptidoglycan-binding protein)
MRVSYQGPNGAVTVRVGDSYVGCARGESIDVPAEVGRNLVEQGWEAVKKSEKESD